MSFPHSPSSFKALVASATGNFCEKFMNQINNLVRLIADQFSYMLREDGEFTEEFAAQICAISCVAGQPGGGGGGGGVGSLAAPINLAASEGVSDHITITWNNPATGSPTGYDLYRATRDDVTDGTFQKIASNIQGTQYDDYGIQVGAYYFYWATALYAGNQVSDYSNSDRGFAGTVPGTLTAISTLVCTKGYGLTANRWLTPVGLDTYTAIIFNALNKRPVISLVWNPVVGATRYDIYRFEADNSAAALRVATGVVPFDNRANPFDMPVGAPGPLPAPHQGITHLGEISYFWNNGDHLVYWDLLPSYDPITATKSYYYWVKAIRDNPADTSAFSNGGTGARGWSESDGAGGGFPSVSGAAGGILLPDEEFTVVGARDVWFALHGSGAGGAGGNATFGAGGGGGSGTCVGKWAAANGSKFRLTCTMNNDTGNAPAETDGTDGTETLLEYSAIGDWSDTITVATSDAAQGGFWVSSGGGTGGVASSGSVHGSVTESAIFDGRNGEAASAQNGGRSGPRFGFKRLTPGHYAHTSAQPSPTGEGGIAESGSGSSAVFNSASAAVGGNGRRGYAYLQYVN